MSAIFISYRRGDDAGEAGRLFDRLKKRFGSEVFMDVEGGIPPGAAFADVIARRLHGGKAVVVVIGPRWSNVSDAHGKRRLENPDDWVRIEIATALAQGLRVFPVLVDGASMPAAAELPAELAPLAGRQAIELRNNSWDYDIGKLIQSLDGVVPGHIVRKLRIPAAVAVAILAAAFLSWKLFDGRPAALNAASLEVTLFTVQGDERGAVFAANRFDLPDVNFPDSVLEQVVNWMADTLNVRVVSPNDVARVIVDVPADLASRSLRIERDPAGPMEIHYWDVTRSAKVRLPIEGDALRTRSEPFTLEIVLPGFGATAIDVTPGVALLDTLTLAPSSGTVRIGVEEITGDFGMALSLTRVLSARAGFTAVSPAALEAARRSLEAARERIRDNPMVQMEIRESLGADYLLVGGIRQSQSN